MIYDIWYDKWYYWISTMWYIYHLAGIVLHYQPCYVTSGLPVEDWQQRLSWRPCWCISSRQKYQTHLQTECEEKWGSKHSVISCGDNTCTFWTHFHKNGTPPQKKAVCPWFYCPHQYKCTPFRRNRAPRRRTRGSARTWAVHALLGRTLGDTGSLVHCQRG